MPSDQPPDTGPTKSRPKSRGLPAHLIPGNPGNSGGKPGRSGRRPEAWKIYCQAQLARPSVRRAISRVLGDPKHPQWVRCAQWLAEYAHGKPRQVVGVEGGESPVELRVLFGDEPGASGQPEPEPEDEDEADGEDREGGADD